MKFSKKILPMVLAMAMVPAMSMPAFADDTNTTTSTVIAPTNNVDLSKHTFEAYQIFKGDLDGKKLSNITWGEADPFRYAYLGSGSFCKRGSSEGSFLRCVHNSAAYSCDALFYP